MIKHNPKTAYSSFSSTYCIKMSFKNQCLHQQNQRNTAAKLLVSRLPCLCEATLLLLTPLLHQTVRVSRWSVKGLSTLELTSLQKFMGSDLWSQSTVTFYSLTTVRGKSLYSNLLRCGRVLMSPREPSVRTAPMGQNWVCSCGDFSCFVSTVRPLTEEELEWLSISLKGLLYEVVHSK